MNNYLCINGKKTELTEQQLLKLGITPAEAESEIAKLSRIARSGCASDHYAIHDKITVGDNVYEIIGIGQDKDAETGEMNTVTLRATFTRIRLPMNEKGSCPGGWTRSSLYVCMKEHPEEFLPEEVRKYLRPVTKACATHDGRLYEVAANLFLFSESEVFGSAIYSPLEEGARYEGFATAKGRYVYNEDGDRTDWWLRSPASGGSDIFCCVDSGGTADGAFASISSGVAFGFCV